MPDNLTPQQRSHAMSRVKNRNTDLEMKVRRALHKQGFRYRVHDTKLLGQPDVVFRRQRIAIFVDGNFWHGRHFHKWKHSVSPFWQEKIGRNRKRDAQVTRALRSMGWTVIRVWQTEVEREFDVTLDRITRKLEAKR